MSTCCSPTMMPDSGHKQADRAKVLSVLDKPGMRNIVTTMLERGPCINSYDLVKQVPPEELGALLSDLRSVGLVQGEIGKVPCFCVNQKTLADIGELTELLDQSI
jgi:hypothetical protein